MPEVAGLPRIDKVEVADQLAARFQMKHPDPKPLPKLDTSIMCIREPKFDRALADLFRDALDICGLGPGG